MSRNANAPLSDEWKANGVEVFKEMQSDSAWCLIAGQDGVFFLKGKHLDVTLGYLLENLVKLEKKDLAPDSGRGAAFWITFYSGDRRDSQTGSIAFWVLGGDGMLVTKGERRGKLALAAPIGKTVREKVRMACTLDNALEVLDCSEQYFVQTAMQSLVQDCFRNDVNIIMPKLEQFLSHDNSETRYWAARGVLKLSPTHEKARKVLKDGA